MIFHPIMLAKIFCCCFSFQFQNLASVIQIEQKYIETNEKQQEHLEKVEALVRINVIIIQTVFFFCIK